MLNEYCSNVLKTELQKAEYDNLTNDQAWSWLMEPTITISNVPTGILLTPIIVAGTLGPIKANIIAGKIVTMLPFIGQSLMAAGVDLAHPATSQFLNSLVDGSSITTEDIDALLALGTKSVNNIAPRRFDSRFSTKLWPHINSDGTVGDSESLAISGFPNDISRADFDISWIAAGRIN